MASLKIDNELERIGDIAYEITERSEAIYNFADVINQFQMQELTQNISKIYNQTIEAYINNNNLLANEVIANCKQAETLSKSIFKEIVAQMVDKSEVIVVATDLILIVRELERIIGHIENIAESIVFIVDAKILKHPEVQAMN
jgi:phosphate transport system protein